MNTKTFGSYVYNFYIGYIFLLYNNQKENGCTEITLELLTDYKMLLKMKTVQDKIVF